MRFFNFRIPRYFRRSPGPSLAVLLSGVVLVPSLCLLWFLHQAVENEQLAVRQKLMDAYRAYLVLAQERLQTHWRQLADRLETQASELPAPALFAREIRAGMVDSLVGFDPTGQISYPSERVVAVPEESDATPISLRQLEVENPAAAALAYTQLAKETDEANVAARALQAASRCLIRAGDQSAAIAVLTHTLAEERYRAATDAQGRLIQPNVELLAFELLKNSAPDQALLVRARLQASLMDYDGSVIASPQRRFLMRELQRQSPAMPAFPTLAAEDLATQWIAAGGVGGHDAALRPSALAGVWQFTSRGGRIVTLHRTENLLTRLRMVILQTDPPSDVLVDLLAPGRELETSLISLPVGSLMPDWRLVLRLSDQHVFDATTDRRISSYVWIVVTVVFTVIVLAWLTWGLVRRQIALTQLRDDLVANVTHELKTPLASMRLFVDTLLHAPELHEATAREYLQLIAKENLRLSRLIDNFLTFSRIERNKYVFAFEEISANLVAKNAVAAVRDRFHAPDCQFEVKIPDHLPRITVDAEALVTALVNLLDNAWKYSGEMKRIAFTVQSENGKVSFAIRDNGIGLSPRETKRIFQRFYQVNQHLSPTGGGCGLGLSIVQFIVTAHGGSVNVASEPDRGSTFTIALPVSAVRKNSQTKT